MTELEKSLAEALEVDLTNAATIDTSDIPEQGEEFFKNAKLTTPAMLRERLAAAGDKGRSTVPMQPVAPRPRTISEQVQQLESIEREIDNRIRRAGVEAQYECERKITEAHGHFRQGLAEETARLGRERDEMVRQANDAYHSKMHELAELLRRRS